MSIVEQEIVNNLKRKKPGRPRAIPENWIEEVIAMYESGMGYRWISNELVNRGIYADWSTVRRVIKNYRRQKDDSNGFSTNSNTILTRPLSANQCNLSRTSES